MMEQKSITGNLESKENYSGDSEKHPAGYFIIKDLRFSLWDVNTFEELEVGKEYTVNYTEKEYNGKIYYNAQSIDSDEVCIDRNKVEFSDEEKKELEKVGQDTSNLKGPKIEIILKEGEIIIIGGFKYKVEPSKLVLVAN